MADLDWRAALVSELVAHGLRPGFDFVVEGMTGGGGSELVGLQGPDHALEVFYVDMGRFRVLLRTADAAEARARLVDEALTLAGGRGRGPGVPPGQEPSMSLREHQAQLRKEQA